MITKADLKCQPDPIDSFREKGNRQKANKAYYDTDTRLIIKGFMEKIFDLTYFKDTEISFVITFLQTLFQYLF